MIYFFLSLKGLNTYVIIKCEDKKVNGRVKKNTLNPEWGTSAIFYRNNPKTPIKIEVKQILFSFS
jgi:hypothetical protein